MSYPEHIKFLRNCFNKWRRFYHEEILHGVDTSRMKTNERIIGVGKQKDGGLQKLFRIIVKNQMIPNTK